MATNTQTGKPATARPSRSRAAATKSTPAAAAKPATNKTVAPAEAVAETPAAAEAPTVPANALKLVLVHVDTTKRYEVFAPDADAEKAGVVGKLYFPLGTKVVKVLATE